MIRCAVFDFDGTLVDSNEIKRRAYFEIALACDPRGTVVEKVLAGAGTGDRYQVTRAIADALAANGSAPVACTPEEHAASLADAYTRYCEKAICACDEIPGATRALEELAAGQLPLFLNTATPVDAIVPILRGRRLEGLFAGIFGGPSSKTENLRLIAAQLDSRPGDIVLIGDGEDDRAAAEAFGCGFIGVVREGPGRFSAAPDCRVHDLARLPEIVAALDGSSR